ncbi:hypothetical protein F5884DRAFT_903212, partial [Xylogone sp. PMI_703]
MLSYNYLLPALYFNATIQIAVNLGNPSTGGGLIYLHAVAGTLRTELGFEPNFVASLNNGMDFATVDPSGDIGRFSTKTVLYPDDGDIPFELELTGIQYLTDEIRAITTTNSTSGLAVPYGSTYSVWTPTFRGGSSKYAFLENSVWVGSETVSDSPTPGEFFIGVKISQVFSTNTSV